MFRHGIRNAHIISRRLSSLINQSQNVSSVKGETVTLAPLTDAEMALLRRGDFRGVISKEEIKNNKLQVPEIALTKLQENFQKMFRVTPESLFEFVRRLEQNDDTLIQTLRKHPQRWLPLLLTLCGSSMSRASLEKRNIIMERLWKAIIHHEIPIDIDLYNIRLKVLLENQIDFDVDKELEEIQMTMKLQPNQKTFQKIVEQLARKGNIDKCKQMIYKMAQEGCVIDAQCNASLVYCFAIKGFYHKADSLIEQSLVKYNKEAFYLAQGACAKAAAARGEIKRLNMVLQRSMDEEQQLQIPFSQVFDTIWELATRTRTQYGFSQNLRVIEQMLQYMNRPKGFFKHLIREFEKHVSNEYYYTAITLLEDTKRIADILQNQGRTLYIREATATICRQMISNKVPMVTVKDIANRMCVLPSTNVMAVYSELLYSALMFRDFSIDERMNYVNKFIDIVDSRRERPHILLPHLASVDNIDDRLKILFRYHNLGYKDLSQVNFDVILQLLLKPLYAQNTSIRSTRDTPINRTAKILKSFGVPDSVTWTLFHRWFKTFNIPEENLQRSFDTPNPKSLHGWLAKHYYEIFESEKAVSTKPLINSTYERLKNIVSSRDSSRALNYISNYGWPNDTNYAEIIPEFLEILLKHEDWKEVLNFLSSLSSRISSYDKEYPVTNVHLLRVIRRFILEASTASIQDVTDLCYELKRMFPLATANKETFFDTMYEYNRIFTKIFERFPEISGENIDQCINLVRTLVKLDLITLHYSETVTIGIVQHVLRRFGWEEAVNTWMKFQSGLNCSNGVVALLRYSASMHDLSAKVNLQYVIHKAQNFISASRIHLLYVAVLLSLKRNLLENKYSEAEKYFEINKNSIDSQGCTIVMKLINALKMYHVDEDFNLKFPELCLKHTDLTSNPKELTYMKTEVLRLCEWKKYAPLALRLYELFKQHGVDFEEGERRRLLAMVEEDSKLARQWIYQPEGMLRIEPNDEIITSKDIYKIAEELRSTTTTSPHKTCTV